MVHALVILAPGFEEIEAVTIVDVLRRADVVVKVAGLEPHFVEGSHGIAIRVDETIEDVDATRFDALVLPGGMPGAANLRDHPRVQHLIRGFHDSGRLLGAICAAPIALERAGVLLGKRATGYPGFALPSARYVEQAVVDAGNIVTSRGPGTALAFALALVEKLVSRESAETLGQRMITALAAS